MINKTQLSGRGQFGGGFGFEHGNRDVGQTGHFAKVVGDDIADLGEIHAGCRKRLAKVKEDAHFFSAAAGFGDGLLGKLVGASIVYGNSNLIGQGLENGNIIRGEGINLGGLNIQGANDAEMAGGILTFTGCLRGRACPRGRATLTDLERNGQLGARIRKQRVGAVGGALLDIVDHQGDAAGGDAADDGLRTDLKAVAAAL